MDIKFCKFYNYENHTKIAKINSTRKFVCLEYHLCHEFLNNILSLFESLNTKLIYLTDGASAPA